MLKQNLLIFFVSLILLFTACKEKIKEVPLPEVHSFTGGTMGTTYSIKVVKNDSTVSKETYLGLKRKVDALLKEVNRQMSPYIVDSEISRFNDYQDTNWFPISNDFARVVQHAIHIGSEADSSLDITIGKIVNLWGFGTQKRAAQVPDSTELYNLLKSIGNDKILVRTKPASIKKRDPNLSIDLSAIAKGFGVDKVGEYLEEIGLNNYMVEIGGEVRTKNKNQKGDDWKIGVSAPDGTMNLQKVILLSGKAMATSGDYRNYFEVDGVRYSHTIDPRTGYPITHKLASVTVVANDCMSADAYATAIDVMGPEKGLEFANKLKLAVFMIIKDESGFKEIITDEFNNYIVPTVQSGGKE